MSVGASAANPRDGSASERFALKGGFHTPAKVSGSRPGLLFGGPLNSKARLRRAEVPLSVGSLHQYLFDRRLRRHLL